MASDYTMGARKLKPQHVEPSSEKRSKRAACPTMHARAPPGQERLERGFETRQAVHVSTAHAILQYAQSAKICFLLLLLLIQLSGTLDQKTLNKRLKPPPTIKSAEPARAASRYGQVKDAIGDANKRGIHQLVCCYTKLHGSSGHSDLIPERKRADLVLPSELGFQPTDSSFGLALALGALPLWPVPTWLRANYHKTGHGIVPPPFFHYSSYIDIVFVRVHTTVPRPDQCQTCASRCCIPQPSIPAAEITFGIFARAPAPPSSPLTGISTASPCKPPNRRISGAFIVSTCSSTVSKEPHATCGSASWRSGSKSASPHLCSTCRNCAGFTTYISPTPRIS